MSRLKRSVSAAEKAGSTAMLTGAERRPARSISRVAQGSERRVVQSADRDLPDHPGALQVVDRRQELVGGDHPATDDRELAWLVHVVLLRPILSASLSNGLALRVRQDESPPGMTVREVFPTA